MTDTTGYLSVKQFCEKWPISSDPERVWYMWLKKWRDSQDLLPVAHYQMQMSEIASRTYTYLYFERKVLRLCFNAGKAPHAAPLHVLFLQTYKDQILSLLDSTSPSQSTTASNKETAGK
jgi:hypothetical protein